MLGVRIFLFVALCVTGLFWGLPAKGNEQERLSILNLPSDPISFQAGPGSDIANSYCAICHSAEYVYMQPPHPREQWMEIVKKMKTSFGCPIPDEQISPLVDYLISQNSVQLSTPSYPVHKEVPDEMSGQAAKHPVDPKKGKTLYAQHCLNCHGTGGKGDGPIGQSLIPPAANLTLLGKKSDKAILDTIRNGRAGTAMPSWKAYLNQSAMRDLLAFLRTLSQ
ncbi:MAG: c-type cytochrome [Nitrospirota bacterium]|jgi:mono/diheme cytochrome c family protein|nr:c-type cytochrome [Nitrospirota bacterium]MDH4361705.1 c-type cytochrome [Nitrospirota bacterium]MDH5574996.1 c-type cytochrome [Nitrospirota bacterium]